MHGRPKTWYFVRPGSKLADVYNILHVPYTAMVLAFVAIGAGVAPQVHVERLAAALVAYFLGLGVGAHAVDQLEPGGSHYVQSLSAGELRLMAAVGLGGGAALGVLYALTVTAWLLPLVGLGLFFALAYPLPSRVAGGRFHNDATFAFAWGFLPLVTSYYADSVMLTPVTLVVGAMTAIAAWTEIRLSRRARSARKEGAPSDYEGPEKWLKALVAATCLAALALLAARLA